MAPCDYAYRQLIEEALANRSVVGYIVWKRRADEWLRENVDGHNQASINEVLYQHVIGGGEVDQVRERREWHRDEHAFHFDFRILIDGRRLYVETVVLEGSTGPSLTVVNIHDQ